MIDYRVIYQNEADAYFEHNKSAMMQRECAKGISVFF